MVAGFKYFPSENWTKLRTNNALERINREIRRRTRVVGCFPDGNAALMLVCARLRHITATKWGTRQYRISKNSTKKEVLCKQRGGMPTHQR